MVKHGLDDQLFFEGKDMFPDDLPFKAYRLDWKRVSDVREHSHNYMQIWYVAGGCCMHRINGKDHMLTKGNLFVVPPFVAHSIRAESDNDACILGCEFYSGFITQNIANSEGMDPLFDFAYLEPFLVATDHVRPRLLLTGRAWMDAEKLMLDLIEEFQTKKSTINGEVEIFDRYREAAYLAIEYIENNYSKKMYLEDAARIAMMSQAYFSYIFKHITGKTFVGYINELRISKSLEMLADGDKKISDICFEVGFNDITYFDKVFKNITGISPGKYRKILSDQ
jgi:AraC-like DNA-binding protein